MVAMLLAGCAATVQQDAPAEPNLEIQARIAEARLAHETGEHDEALALLREAIAIDPQPELLQRAARLAAALDQWPEALTLADQWLQADPDSGEALQLQTVAALRSGKTDVALLALNRGLGDAPADQDWMRAVALLAAGAEPATAERVLTRLVDARDGLPAGFQRYLQSRLAWQLGERVAARARIGEALQQRPDFEYALWSARMAQAEGETERALADIRLARAARPDDESAARAEVELLRELGRTDEALTVLNQLPASVDTLYTVALLQVEEDQIARAGATWQRLVATVERDGQGAWQAGILAEMLGLEPEALTWYGQVDGEFQSRAQLRRAIVLGNLGRVAEARALTAELRAGRDPDLAEQAWMVEGQLLLEAGRGEEAIGLYSEAVAQEPSNVDLLYARAMAAVQLDDLELAEQDLRTIIQNDPENAVALNALGYTLSDRTDRQNEALRLIETALALDPDNAAIIDSMGWVLFRLGRPDEALPYLERAVELEPHPEIVAHLIEARLATGDEVGARVLAARWAAELSGDETFDATLERLELEP
ncbi:MAG: tetratricopeptide repeat protein [Wenzhouxiangellaceae bacterium]|nr:tetratricopeptide repeat protein [Wenzhouxiangellaceae bacterium]